jgi:hypothetical protein
MLCLAPFTLFIAIFAVAKFFAKSSKALINQSEYNSPTSSRMLTTDLPAG